MEILVDSALGLKYGQSANFRGLRHLVWATIPPDSFIVYDLLRRRVRAVLSTSAASSDSFWNRLLLPITIGILGTTMGVAPLHCACLDREGGALLIAGTSGAGKSTLAAALAQEGFALVSDDWTYVSEEGPALVAHGLSAPIKLLPDAASFFPELQAHSLKTALNGELAYEMDPRASLGFSVRETSHPRSIFFLERSGIPGCRFVPCRAEYVREFFEKSAERLPAELTEAIAFRSRIIQKLSLRPSWIVRTGESPQRTAASIVRFLSEVRHGAA
jgi:hypothetical protein